jgi:uncharacterized coiled-coil DUF342 family protein
MDINASLRDAHEQLRVDHIATLEVLQDAVDENKRLGDELDALKKELKRHVGGNVAIENVATVDETKLLIEKISKQDELIVKLKSVLSNLEQDMKSMKEKHIHQMSAEMSQRKKLEDDLKTKNVALADVVEKEDMKNQEISRLKEQLDESAVELNEAISTIAQVCSRYTGSEICTRYLTLHYGNLTYIDCTVVARGEWNPPEELNGDRFT